MCMEEKYKRNRRINMKQQLTFAFKELMRLNAFYTHLNFWLGSALVALMDAPPLLPFKNFSLKIKFSQKREYK